MIMLQYLSEGVKTGGPATFRDSRISPGFSNSHRRLEMPVHLPSDPDVTAGLRENNIRTKPHDMISFVLRSR